MSYSKLKVAAEFAKKKPSRKKLGFLISPTHARRQQNKIGQNDNQFDWNSAIEN